MEIAISRLKRKWIVMTALLIALAVLPVSGVPQAWMLYIFLYFVYLSSANMWNLLCGYSGLISLCQPAFIGIAGYTMTILTWTGVPFYMGIVAGAILAGVFAIVISIPVFRLSGIYFAVGTLVVPEALRIFFLLWRPVGGALAGGGAGYMVKGLSGLSMTHYYWMALFVGAASIVLMRIILSSKLGLALAAIRDNPRSAAGSGMNVFRLKLYSFVISAFVTGIAGALFYVYQGYIEPSSSFSIQWTMTLILATVIGGINIEEGPIVGTAVVVFLLFILAKYPGISLLIQGAILVGLMLLAPQGITGTLRKYRWYKSLARAAGLQEKESPEATHEHKIKLDHMDNTKKSKRRIIMSEELVNTLSELKEEESLEIVRRRLAAGDDPHTILEEAKQAMEIVGKRFEDGTYFIPQLVFSGEILKAISEMIKPKLKKAGETERLGQFIIGTVKGDIHDIGKNIVTFMLDVNGVEVHDLGIDVPVEKFIEKIKETKAPVLGLSGFLTVAFDTMKETIDAIKEAGLRDQVKIIIGGGNINEKIKNYAGADAYGVDAMAAVAYAKKVFASGK